MIPAHEVAAGVLARLRATGRTVHDLVAPVGTPAPYAVLEYPPGPTTSDGDLDDPESDLAWRCRIRCIGADSTAPATIDGAREQAQRLAHQMKAAVLDRGTLISGTTWTVAAREHLAHGGTDHSGPIVNVVDDFDLWIVPV